MAKSFLGSYTNPVNVTPWVSRRNGISNPGTADVVRTVDGQAVTAFKSTYGSDEDEPAASNDEVNVDGNDDETAKEGEKGVMYDEYGDVTLVSVLQVPVAAIVIPEFVVQVLMGERGVRATVGAVVAAFTGAAALILLAVPVLLILLLCVDVVEKALLEDGNGG